ncbi:MAG: hypothetical protein VXA09_06290, partial [Burkholderiaceae bacterium]
MNKKIALFLVALMFTLSLSGCLRNGKGGSNDQPGVVYEPGPYDILVYEDIVYASGLAQTDSSTEASAVPLKLDVYCPDSNST